MESYVSGSSVDKEQSDWQAVNVIYMKKLETELELIVQNIIDLTTQIQAVMDFEILLPPAISAQAYLAQANIGLEQLRQKSAQLFAILTDLKTKSERNTPTISTPQADNPISLLAHGVWVYQGTNMKCREAFRFSDLKNVFKNNKGIVKATLEVAMNGVRQSIRIEHIAEKTRERRTQQWVYKGTNKPYTEPFEVDELQHPRIKNNGNIFAGSLRQKDGRFVELELIRTGAREMRKPFWVRKGTYQVFTDSFKIDDLKEKVKNPNSGEIVGGKICSADGRLIELECITKAMLHNRKRKAKDQAQIFLNLSFNEGFERIGFEHELSHQVSCEGFENLLANVAELPSPPASPLQNLSFFNHSQEFPPSSPNFFLEQEESWEELSHYEHSVEMHFFTPGLIPQPECEDKLSDADQESFTQESSKKRPRR